MLFVLHWRNVSTHLNANINIVGRDSLQASRLPASKVIIWSEPLCAALDLNPRATPDSFVVHGYLSPILLEIDA